MATKVTIMRLKVDLQCEKCYKKVKKLLCKFPQIQEQTYDEKQNTVTITVVCCSPEKIRDKLCCKGEGCIKSIEIVEPPKRNTPSKKGPNPCEQVKPTVIEPEKPQPDPEKPKENTPERNPGSPPPTQKVPIRTCCVPCSEGRPGGPCFQSDGGPRPPSCHCDGYCGRLPTSARTPTKPPVPACPLAVPLLVGVPIGTCCESVPRRTCCASCREGRPGGPCFEGYGGLRLPQPPPCHCDGSCESCRSESPPPTPKPCKVTVPRRTCCASCYEGRPGGPCFEGYGGPRPLPCYSDGYYGRPIYDSYGGSRPCYLSRCDQYFSEENPTGCTII